MGSLLCEAHRGDTVKEAVGPLSSQSLKPSCRNNKVDYNTRVHEHGTPLSMEGAHKRREEDLVSRS